MKNLIGYSILVLAVFLFISNNSVIAQEEGNVYVIRYHKSVMPVDGSVAERDSFIIELVQLHKSNKKTLSVMTLVPYDSSSQDWVIIYEYHKYEDIDEAAKINLELNKKKWPDDAKREKFFQRLLEYFPVHTDQVYKEIPKFRQ